MITEHRGRTERSRMMQKKLKLLYVLDILKKTDEQHPITTNQIVSKLENYGIEAERKSVLRDIMNNTGKIEES